MKYGSLSNARVLIEPVDLRVSVGSAVVSFSRAVLPAILETSLPGTNHSRFSVLASDPVDEFVHKRTAVGCPFQSFAEHAGGFPKMGEIDTGLPFLGGWIGFFSYEAGLGIERVESTTQLDLDLPFTRFCLYDSAAIYDHLKQQWYIVAVEWPAPIAASRPSPSARLAALRDKLSSAAAFETENAPVDQSSSSPAPNMSPGDYFKKVDRAKRYIEAGDIYQVNLTQHWQTRTDASPLELYQSLRDVSPSSHAAFLPWGQYAILSSSMELFLDLRRGHVVTRPIKGTRPRSKDPQLDAAYMRELARSEKDHAELTMIVDLLRNDLGRVCSFGSVSVTSPGAIEQHPNVFHRVATIEGDLEPGRTWVDLLLASFPGGSVTGAPKIRAMQIIDELEPTTRGVYCGSIGMVGLDGSMSMNIAIRTMVQVDDVVHIYAGGAIVADSTPEQEYDETIAKAAGMMQAVGCGVPDSAQALEEPIPL